MIKKQRNECYKQGLLETTNAQYLTSDGNFLDEDAVKNGCSDDCSAKNICISVIQKLNKNNFVGASILLNTLSV